jgi:hypothetical protein
MSAPTEAPRPAATSQGAGTKHEAIPQDTQLRLFLSTVDWERGEDWEQLTEGEAREMDALSDNECAEFGYPWRRAR